MLRSPTGVAAVLTHNGPVRQFTWMVVGSAAALLLIHQAACAYHASSAASHWPETVRDGFFLAAAYVVGRVVDVFTAHAPNQPPTQ